MTTVIEAEGLTKRFGTTQALAGVDITAERGRVLALLGPNGAGKTTIVRVLSTLLRPDGGHARISGYDVVSDAVQVRQLIALTGQYASVDDELTGTENLIMICRLLGLSRAASRQRAREVLERFDLADAAGRAVKTYSGGMRRRLDLGASLLGEPEVLFLDEPTTGLDPRARSQMWETVRGVVAAGATVLLTTQYLDEADELADHIAVIDRGLVVASGTPSELKARTGSQTLAVRAADRGLTGQVAAAVAAATGMAPDVNADTGLVTASISDPAIAPAVVRRLDDAGIVATELSLRLPSLDEVFLTLTGHRAEDGAARPERGAGETRTELDRRAA
ncbi:MAG TPA: ATP-binding cassette domain-containing protein [Streptosporangiaceae bacterium]